MTEIEIAQMAGDILSELDKKYTRFDKSKYDVVLNCETDLGPGAAMGIAPMLLPKLNKGSFETIRVSSAHMLAEDIYDLNDMDDDEMDKLYDILDDILYITDGGEGDDSLNNINDEFGQGVLHLVFKND